jgi:hypothetical protein
MIFNTSNNKVQVIETVKGYLIVGNYGISSFNYRTLATCKTRNEVINTLAIDGVKVMWQV